MKLKMDLVEGAQLESAIFSGQIIRMAMVTDVQADLPQSIPDPTILIKSLALQGMPQKGEAHPGPAPFNRYYCKRHIVRSLPGPILLVSIIYEFLGTIIYKDSSSLSNVPTQLHFGDFKPLYVTWTPKNGNPVQKLLTLSSVLPLRHFVISQTVEYNIGSGIIDYLGYVNESSWRGKDIGYWLFSDFDATSSDDGITVTYVATFTTKNTENWMQLGFMTDDTGQPVQLDPADQAALPGLRAADYQYGVFPHNGFTIVGNYPTYDFTSLFGLQL